MGVLRRLSVRRASLHGLTVALARHPHVVDFSRALVRGLPARERLSRITTVFTFVGCLIDVPPPEGETRDGVDLLVAVLGMDRGPAVVLAAMLLALGERAHVECTREMAFVRVELDVSDLRRVPPHAGLFERRGRYYLPLDPRWSRSPLGFLPRPVRDVLARRRAAGKGDVARPVA